MAIMLKDRIVGIIGLGYVGLPLAILCMEKGFKVIGFENNKEKCSLLLTGKSYITDIDDQQIMEVIEKGQMEVAHNDEWLSQCDIIIVCVPTPLNEYKKPNYEFLYAAIHTIRQFLREGQLIIVESTIVPTTSRNIILPMLEESGLSAGKDFFFSFSPERIDPGNEIYKVEETPKLVSGYSEICREKASAFYNEIGITPYTVSSLEVAEMSKILENTYRDINIALINEMAQVCKLYDINIWNVIDAAASKPFGFKAFYPGPGVGGHCIPKDCTFYTYLAREKGVKASLAECAREINDQMPDYILFRIKSLLSHCNKSIDNSKILILGITYKKEVNDIRESPSIKIINLLLELGATVFYHDPFIKTLDTNNKEIESIAFEDIHKTDADCIILSVAHNCYSDYDYPEEKIVFDLTNSIQKPPFQFDKL
ncbi:MAG: nucleotide sugar dehydrogenase [Aminipila sp.]